MGNHGNLEQILEYLERDINLQENIYLYAEKRYKGRNLLTDKQQKRKKDFIDLMRNYSSENFTPEMTNKIVSGLEENFCISTAGHH